MGKSRDRANRSGSDPVNIGAARLSLDSAGSSDIKVTAQDGTTLKKVFAEELHVGTGDDRVILKRNSSDGKVQFQTTDGSTTENATVGTGVVANPGDLPLSGNSAGDTKFVTSNNNLMIYNGTGWYKIATVTNSSPTISSAGNATYNFATDGTPVIVEITATDPEGFALQYKYQVTSGSLGSTATVTSSSTSGGTYSAINANTLTSNNYFKVTPSTNTAHAGTFSLTFSASDGVNVANSSASSFTLEFSTYGSVLFDGTGDYLTTATDTDLIIGTNNFTIEFWVYLNSFSGYPIIFDRRASSANNQVLETQTNGKFRWYAGGSYRIQTDSAINTNEWVHIAVVRNSGTTTIYLNGTAQSTTYSDSTNYSGSSVILGKHYSSAGSYVDGYISNYREVIGTAVYTTDFTPAGPLTDITNTKLLTAHKNNEIVDGSSNGVTITKSGDVTANAYNPFPIDTTGYGSLHFDGTGDHAIASGSNLAIGTNNFTIEYWIYAKNFDTVGTVWDNRNDGENVSMLSNITTNGEPRLYANAGYRITANPPMNENEWNHIAFQRASNVTKMYLNGIEQTTTYSDTNNYPGQRFFLGSEKDTTTEFDGYISNFREVVGSNVYTPTALSGWSGSIHMNGGTLSSNGISGSYTMGTGDFTIETWFKYTASATLGSNDYLFDLGTSNDIRITFGSGNINVDDGGQVFSYGMHSTIDTARWYHLAYTRTGGTSSLYLDGQLKASIGDSSYNHAESTFTLGNYGGGGSYVWSGYLTDFRIVKGKAVYTGNFTRPSGPLTKTGGTYPSSTNISNPTASQTVLLIGNNSSSITDVSDTGHTLSSSGSISASSDVPTGNSITVPASPLTAVTNTKLLTAQRPIASAITNGSTLFPGEGTQITTAASSDFTLGTGDFTVEGWFNWAHLPGSAGSGNYVFDFGGNGLVGQFNGANALGFWTSGDGYINGSVSISTGTWYHAAWVRISGTGKFYLDGVQIASGSLAKDVTTNAMTMNGYHTGYSYGQQDVKYSDFRVVKGLGVYTGAFSRPTGPLTKTGGTYPNNTNRTDPTASQTVLLTHQESTPAVGIPSDNSDSGHTLTAVGFGSQAVKGAGYQQVASDQSTNSYSVTTNGNTRNARNWPFNYSG